MFIVEWKVNGKEYSKDFLKFSTADSFYDDLIIDMVADINSVYLYEWTGINSKKSLY